MEIQVQVGADQRRRLEPGPFRAPAIIVRLDALGARHGKGRQPDRRGQHTLKNGVVTELQRHIGGTRHGRNRRVEEPETAIHPQAGGTSGCAGQCEPD